MLIVEIENENINEAYCPAGHYKYTIKVNRKVIATGHVDHEQSKHWSMLLKKIADDGRARFFTQIMGQTPQEFMDRRK